MPYFDKLTYTKSWNSAADFPTYEPDETRVRADLQLLHDEARAAINALVEKLEAAAYAENLPVSSAQFSAGNLKAALEEILAAARSAQAGTLLDGSVPEAKLSAAVQEKLNACDVVYSMNSPTGAENPGAGYPAAKLWLRPPFTLANLVPDWNFSTGGDWTASYGAKSVSGGALILSGTAASQYGQASCPLAVPAGHTVRVYLRASELSGQAASLKMTVNGAEYALAPGAVTAADASAGAGGTVNVTVTADWSSTSAAASSALRLEAFAAVDRTALPLTGAVPLAEANLDALVSAALPFGVCAQARAVYEQELPGVWTQMIFDALPVERGGTGKKTLAADALLAGNGAGAVRELAPGEAAVLLGALRWGEFAYAGEGGHPGSRTIALPQEPKLLFFKGEAGSPLDQGGSRSFSHTGSWRSESGNPVSYQYTCSVSLSGSALTLASGQRADDLTAELWDKNAAGTSYTVRYLY